MMANLKYEFIKLFTIRSTYIMSILALAFSALIMIVTVAKTPNLHSLVTHDALTQLIFTAPSIASMVGVVAAILIVGHEYRHNTIAYTLTASRSRANVLLAKLLITIFFSVALALTAVIIVMICYCVGITLRDPSLALPTPDLTIYGTLLRSVLYCAGLALSALLIASLVRNIVFAITAFFLLPTIEQLLHTLLKDNSVYLPATALDQVKFVGDDPLISPLKGGLIFLIYFVVGGIISYLLFVRRDAN
jgi:ABC-2 type transport system permease protein